MPSTFYRLTYLSLHDALPIFLMQYVGDRTRAAPRLVQARLDRGQGERAKLQLDLAAIEPRLDESGRGPRRSEEHTSELQLQSNLVCRLLLESIKHRWRRTLSD